MKKKTILITGGRGLLGKALLETASNKDSVVASATNKSKFKDPEEHRYIQMDITKSREVNQVFDQIKPIIVIHAASAGSVDFCEKNQKEAYKINVLGTKNLIKASQKHNSKFIFTSSNAVFDGLKPPYSEESKVSPINYYGQTKLEAEKLVAESGLDYVIARLTLMYGWNNPEQRLNPVTWLLEKLSNNSPVKIVNDTYTNPLYNIQAAQIVWKIVELGKNTIYHIAGKDRVNRFEFALKTAEVFNLKKELIESVGSDYFTGFAPRMPDTTYETKRMEESLGILPLTIEEGLTDMKKNYERS